MRAEIKYLSIGLFIGICATGLLLTGMLITPTLAASPPLNTPISDSRSFTPGPQSSPTAQPSTPTFTPTPTLIWPTETATSTITPTVTPTVPSPTPTFSDTLMGLLQDGYLSQTGPLELKVQIRVYESSLKYVRTNTEGSRLIGEQINGIGYGSPSNICGPLSIAILQDVGLIDSSLNPHTYWLLNADIAYDRRLLSKAFPPEQFESIRINRRLNEIDWNETPLYPGDFIYLYAGYGGNFEHMLVVSRVDVNGHAYSVTNHRTPNGFIISEVLLYNPANSNVGMFPIWTARLNADTGSTGFAGLEIWRQRSP